MSKQREEAAKEALRIIEEAGDGETEDVDFAEARYRLRCSVKNAAERAEREAERARLAEQAAEDEKVCDYFELANDGARPAWDIIPESTKRDCRSEYRRAKRAVAQGFFAPNEDAAKTAKPLVVNLEDPEPHRAKVFLEGPDGSGDTWRHHELEGWGYDGSRARYTWEEFQETWPEVFPLTEVTE